MTMEAIPLEAEQIDSQQKNGWMPGIVGSLSACILGGLLSFIVLEMLAPIFPFADLPELGPTPSAKLIQEYHKAEFAFRSNNGAADCATIGLCIGALMGLVTVRTKRVLSMIAGGIGGLIGGAIAGYLIGDLVAHGLIFKAEQTVLRSTLFHLAVWASIAVGFAFAICLVHPNVKQSLAALIAGLVSGAMASISYNALGSILYPMSDLSFIVPNSLNERVLWFATGAIALGVGFGMGTRSKKRSGTH